MAKQLKILIATGIMPPAIGGPASYTVQLKQQLELLGQQVSILTYGDEATSSLWVGQSVKVVDKQATLLIKYWRFFVSLWQESKAVDIIYAHDLVSTGLPAACVKFLQAKKKLVIRLGGDFLWEKAYNQAWTNKPLSQYYLQPKNFKEKIYLAIYKFVLNRADHIIYSTQWQADLSAKFLAVKADKISVIQNPFPQQRKVDSQHNNDLLVAGRLIPLKNIVTIIKIMPQLPTFNLRIVGSGPQKNELLNLTNELGLAKRVSFMDSVDSAELANIITQSYLVLVPSISDISPNIVLESIVLAKPVIVTRECGFYQDYQDQLIFVDPFDENDIVKKINNLLDAKAYQAYQKSLAQINMRHDWQAVAGEHLDLFLSLVK